MPQMTMVKAINDALRVELKRDPNVLLFGEDVGKNGGVFRVSDGLQKNSGKIASLIHRLPNPESAVWQSVLPAKDSVRLLKSNLSVLSLKPWIRFVYKLPACVTGPAAVFMPRSCSAHRLAEE